MATTEPALLRIDGLHFAYPGRPALFDGWSAQLPAGVTRLDGEPGGGQTTLLRLLAGELRPGHGRLTLAGHDAAADPSGWRRQVCWLDPRDPAWDALTAAELMAVLRSRHPTLDEAAWARHLDGFGMAAHLAKPMHALSTGSRRKAALAAALSSGCALILLDEPCAGLDRPSLAWLAQALDAIEPGGAQLVLLGSAHGLDEWLDRATGLLL